MGNLENAEKFRQSETGAYESVKEQQVLTSQQLEPEDDDLGLDFALEWINTQDVSTKRSFALT